jgi:hypothetical protein
MCGQHHLKFFVYDAKRKVGPDMYDSIPYSAEKSLELKEKVNRPKLVAWILKKIKEYGVSRTVCPLLVVLDDFAGHPLLERKETPLVRMMTKCRHYSCTFIVAVQTPKYVIKNFRRQATDVVVWLGLNQDS